MLRLELDNVTATLESFTSRKEKQGPERLPAATIKVSTAQNADVLAHFNPTLRAHLFEEGQDLGGPFLHLRDSHMVFPLARDEEMTGCTLKIGYGVGSPLVFEGVKVGDFRLTPHDGGTVVLGFKASFLCGEASAGKLHLLNEEGIELTLEPAELPTMKDAE